ncbi:MAG: transketolase, partial [Gracilibacteraceae bacterium]|nr:transketolase [Gracilibacteraceae bacterium]
MTEAEIAALAREARRNVIRMVTAAGSGHPGGSLSAADILATLYGGEMRVDPARPDDPDRDRFILSKGHAAPALYAVLAERGFFSRAELTELRRIGGKLQGHPDMRKVPGVDASTGSLGQGLAIAGGLAM